MWALSITLTLSYISYTHSISNNTLPWSTLAWANSQHYIDTTNPSITESFCPKGFSTINWRDVAGGRPVTASTPVYKVCESSEDNTYKKIKIRTNNIDTPEVGYEFSTVECLHLFKLEDRYDEQVDDIIAAHQKESAYVPAIFPRAYYLNNKHDISDSSVCLSEFVEGVSFNYHVSTLSTDDELLDLTVAVLDTLRALASLNILHRDLHPENLVVHRLREDRPTSVQERMGSRIGPRQKFWLVLIDFTWATSPYIRAHNDPPDYMNLHYKSPGFRSDMYSVGFMLRDVLNAFSRVDASWLSPVIETMTGRRPFTGWQDLIHTAIELKSSKSAPMTRATLSGEALWREQRRQALCNQPNTFAGQAKVEKRYFRRPDDTGTLRPEIIPMATASGYQSFEVENDPHLGIEIRPGSETLALKDSFVSPTLKGITRGLTVYDVGGNLGFFCARAVEYGAERAVLVDMDTEYTSAALQMYEHLGPPFSNRITVENRRLGDLQAGDYDSPQSADIVIALALIHWAYNCSETNGNLAKTIGTLAVKARKALIIEWIDPSDPAILAENHLGVQRTTDSVGEDLTDRNMFDSPYTFEEFEGVMRRMFSCYRHIGNVTSTRRLYIGLMAPGRYLNDGSRSSADVYRDADLFSYNTFNCWP